jgi:hypothetical protein
MQANANRAVGRAGSAPERGRPAHVSPSTPSNFARRPFATPSVARRAGLVAVVDLCQARPTAARECDNSLDRLRAVEDIGPEIIG